MTNITIPMSDDLLSFLDDMVSSNRAETRAGLVRRIISQRRDEELLSRVREAREQYAKGEYFDGDLRQILTRIKRESSL